jgi:hypothetical protein
MKALVDCGEGFGEVQANLSVWDCEHVVVHHMQTLSVEGVRCPPDRIEQPDILNANVQIIL